MTEPNLRSLKIGCYSFSEVFSKKMKNDLLEKYVTEKALFEWLGDGWDTNRIQTVLSKHRWIAEWYCFEYDGQLGFSAVAITAIILCDPMSTDEEKKMAAELIFTRGLQSKQAAKAFAPRF